MSRVYHTAVVLTGGRPLARGPLAPFRGDPVIAGQHITIALLVTEGY